jgi:hypothetical protein
MKEPNSASPVSNRTERICLSGNKMHIGHKAGAQVDREYLLVSNSPEQNISSRAPKLFFKHAFKTKNSQEIVFLKIYEFLNVFVNHKSPTAESFNGDCFLFNIKKL